MTLELRYYQREALDALYQFFMTHDTGNPLIGLPTGTGKSILPAAFIQAIMKQWPNQRFLMITHVAELIKQNAAELLKVWPEAPLGIYSAGLKSKEAAHPIVFGGIQSMIKKPHLFGHRDIIFVDEAHLVSAIDSSQYQTFFTHMKLINPHIKIIGMTATLYRMGMGMITDNGLFTHIAYDMTNLEGFNKLVAEGYMATLVPRRTKTELDVSNVGIIKGEFVATQLQGAVDKAEITYKAIEEAIHAGHDRKSWLIFASGIDHAEHIAEQLKAFGIACEPVHSKRNDAENDKAIAAFKSGELRAIVNYGKLTTGFNHPEIDLILMLRPTMSVPLWVQMLGRGTRPAPGKKNCLVLDFARNTPRLGPINDPAIPKKKGEAIGELPVKICEGCSTYNHISARVCSECGEPFSFQVKITSRAGSDELIRSKPVFKTQIERFKVDYDIYAKHTKVGRPPSLRVTYFAGNGMMFKEYICLEHQGMAKKVAREWWRKRSIVEPPNTIDEALKLTGDLRKPRFISVDVAAAYPTIIGAEF